MAVPGGRNGGRNETKAGPGGAAPGPGTGNKAAGPGEAAGRWERFPPPGAGGRPIPRQGPLGAARSRVGSRGSTRAGSWRGDCFGGLFCCGVFCWVFFPVFAESKELNPVPVKFGGFISVNNASKASLGPRETRRWGIKTIWERINLPRRRGRSGAMAAGPEPEPGRRAGTSPSPPQPGPRFYHHHHGYYFKFWRVRNQPPAAQLARTTGALNGRSRQCLNLYLPEPCKARNNLHSINCFSIGHRLELKDATTLP